MTRAQYVFPEVNVRDSARKPKHKGRGPGSGVHRATRGMPVNIVLQIRLWYWRDCMKRREVARLVTEQFGLRVPLSTLTSIIDGTSHAYTGLPQPHEIHRKEKS